MTIFLSILLSLEVFCKLIFSQAAVSSFVKRRKRDDLPQPSQFWYFDSKHLSVWPGVCKLHETLNHQQMCKLCLRGIANTCAGVGGAGARQLPGKGFVLGLPQNTHKHGKPVFLPHNPSQQFSHTHFVSIIFCSRHLF